MTQIGASLRTKLFLITGIGTVLLLVSAVYGLWSTWSETHALHAALATAAGTEQVAMEQAAINTINGDVYLSLGMMGAAVVISFLWFMFVVQRAIVSPAQSLVSDLERLAKGDFSVPIVPHTRDELGRIAVAAGQVQEQIGGLIAGIRQAVADVSAGMQAVRAQIERTDDEVTRQEAETDQVAAAMNEMAATSLEVSKNTEETSKATREAQKLSQDGAFASTNAIASIESLGGRVREAAEVIQRVEEHTENIGRILEVITQIAEQTNLLALNAAIEAARAGEQGRGFAVVAEEVRSLATRTQASTAQIQEMIDQLQNGARDAVEVMGKVRAEAAGSEEQVETAAISLAEIADAVKRIDQMGIQIATAAHQQSQVADEVSRSLIGMSDSFRNTRSIVGSAVESGREIEVLTSELKELSGRFRL